MNSLDDMQKLLKEIADVVNSFKSEAVQLRVVDVLLGQLGVPTASDAKGDQRPPRRAKRRKKSNDDEASGGEAEKPAPRKAVRSTARSSTSPGAFAMINQLLSDGFFKAPRTIGAIVEHCGSTKGHHYKANECSPALLRLLRDSKLKRAKNRDGQYEYTQA
jgi:hypothetical protein